MKQVRHEGTLPGKTLTRIDNGYITHATIGQIPCIVYCINTFAFGDLEVKLKLPAAFINVCPVTTGLVLNITAAFTIWPLVKYNSVTNVYISRTDPKTLSTSAT